MARLQMVCVRDRALDTFARPFFVLTLNQAVRSFQDEVNNAQSELARHPDDYELYHVGEWDEESAEFFGQRPKQIALAANLRNPVNVQK